MAISIILFLICLTSIYASPVGVPVCYDDDGDFPAPVPLDCTIGMGAIKNDEYFTKPQTWGISENSPRNVPIDWIHRSCMMTITALDESKTDTFALSETMSSFAAVKEICVKRRKLGQGFGGYIPVGHGQEFYAVVQYNPDYPTEYLRRPSNQTQNTTALPVPPGSGFTDTS